jgi:hypothetical protein
MNIELIVAQKFDLKRTQELILTPELIVWVFMFNFIHVR